MEKLGLVEKDKSGHFYMPWDEMTHRSDWWHDKLKGSSQLSGNYESISQAWPKGINSKLASNVPLELFRVTLQSCGVCQLHR
jgi:hypothetical protein